MCSIKNGGNLFSSLLRDFALIEEFLIGEMIKKSKFYLDAERFDPETPLCRSMICNAKDDNLFLLPGSGELPLPGAQILR